MKLNTDEIKGIIPHRDPFLMIDEVTDMEVGKYVKARKHVTGDEDFFRGHFPQKKVMPGVLIIEALAQAGAVGVLSMEENKGKLGFLGSVKNAKFRYMVTPGDVLDLEVVLTKVRSNAGVGEAKAYVGDKLAVSCEIMFAIGE